MFFPTLFLAGFVVSTGRKRRLAVAGIFFAVAASAAAGQQTNNSTVHKPLPYWAYAVDPPRKNVQAEVEKELADKSLKHVPGSEAAFTVAQTQDFFNPPDWHPDGHSAMPAIVAHGRGTEVFACGYCHLPNGQGRPENASLAGLPADYIVQQMADFKSGLRKSSEPKHLPTSTMIGVAGKANQTEVNAAAQYFSALHPAPWIRVVEKETVPRTHVAGWMLVENDNEANGTGIKDKSASDLPSDKNRTEPIGQRIIETPENLERTELRDDHSGFIAYVPTGSLKQGRVLVSSGGAGKTLPCAVCHGPGLKGMGNVPVLAGRSPSYIVRQLLDIKDGARNGVLTQQMKPAVANLTLEDMISIAAYIASLQP